MVSAVLVIVLALSTLQVLDRAGQASADNRLRNVASGLAQSDQEAIRQLPMSQLSGGYHPAPATKAVGGITYTITSTADWYQDATGAITCSSTNGKAEYLKTRSVVTWPNMGSVKPVVAEGIVTPGAAALTANKGALTVLLTRADGTGTGGITVSAGGVSGTTDSNGCAVLADIDAGSQTLTYSAGGYVDKNSVGSVSKPVTIGSGSIAQVTGNYDSAGRLNIDLYDDAGNANAYWPSVTLDHASRDTPSQFTVATTGSSPDAAVDLFPFASPYSVHVGNMNCPGNDPENASYTGGAETAALAVAGSSTPVALTMKRVTVTVTNSSGAAQQGANVFLAPESSGGYGIMSGCSESLLTRNAFLTDSNGQAKIPVPLGVWRICADLKIGTKYGQIKTNTSGTSDRPVVNSPTGTLGTYAPRLTTTLKLPSSGSTSTAPTTC